MSIALDAYCDRFGGELSERLERSTRTLLAHADSGGLRHRQRDPQIAAAIAVYDTRNEQ